MKPNIQDLLLYPITNDFNEMPKGDTDLGKIQKMEKFAASLGNKIAVVQVKLGESIKEAWKRHLTEYPGDASVMIKIFNQPVPQRSMAMIQDIN